MKGRGEGRLRTRKQSRGRSTSPISLHSSDSASEAGPAAAASHPPAAARGRRNAGGGAAAPSAAAPQPASLQVQAATWRREDFSAASAGEQGSLEPSWPDSASPPRPSSPRVQPSPCCVELLSDSESDQSSPRRAARAASPHGMALVQSPEMHRALQTSEAAEAMAVTPVAASPPAACGMQLGTPLQPPSPAAQPSPSPACSMQLGTPLQHLRGSTHKSHDVISLLTP